MQEQIKAQQEFVALDVNMEAGSHHGKNSGE